MSDPIFETVVGAVSLRVSDIDLMRAFYGRAIGLEARGEEPAAAELAEAGGTVLVRLDSSTAQGAETMTIAHTGLFHTAFRYPDRAALGAAVKRTAGAGAAYQGASDHGVSEAVYFGDPEGNGIELYRDRPYEEWPSAEPGRVGMFTAPLDVEALLEEAEEPAGAAALDIGHVHLMVSDAERSLGFWRDVVGLDERQRFGPQAIFLAEGLYHHHVGANSWHSSGADPAPPDRPGLESFEINLASAESVDATAARLEAAGVTLVVDDGKIAFEDPDGIRVLLASR